MQVERFKGVIWAADVGRTVEFYQSVFDATVVRDIGVIVEVEIAGVALAIHSGGEGNLDRRTWTGMSFQVADVVEGATEVRAAGGVVDRDPQSEDGEPPHLAMCVDPAGNEFMLTRKRS
ncbi:MAG: VOC family protein [Chthoniobacterales bacterium]